MFLEFRIFVGILYSVFILCVVTYALSVLDEVFSGLLDGNAAPRGIFGASDGATANRRFFVAFSYLSLASYSHAVVIARIAQVYPIIIPKKPPTVGSSGHPAYSARVVASSGIHPHAVQ
jgi:hypothetical protein